MSEEGIDEYELERLKAEIAQEKQMKYGLYIFTKRSIDNTFSDWMCVCVYFCYCVKAHLFVVKL